MTNYRCDSVPGEAQPMTFGVDTCELNVERLKHVDPADAGCETPRGRQTARAAPVITELPDADHRMPGPRIAGSPDRPTSDLDHFEVFFACAALRTGPVNRNVRPTSARRNAFVRQTGFFVVNPAANQAHPALIFHSCVAS